MNLGSGFNMKYLREVRPPLPTLPRPLAPLVFIRHSRARLIPAAYACCGHARHHGTRRHREFQRDSTPRSATRRLDPCTIPPGVEPPVYPFAGRAEARAHLHARLHRLHPGRLGQHVAGRAEGVPSSRLENHHPVTLSLIVTRTPFRGLTVFRTYKKLSLSLPPPPPLTLTRCRRSPRTTPPSRTAA
jgi:hypothetical protein